MGISLESAVMNTTKTLSGMQGELGEKLPAAFKDLTAEQLKAGEGIKFIREQFKGTAEQEADTLTGSLAQLTNAFGDLQEQLGSALAPAIESTSSSMTDFLTAITTELQINKTEVLLTSGAYQNMSIQAKKAFLESRLAAFEFKKALEESNPFLARLIGGIAEVGTNAENFLPAPIQAFLGLNDVLETNVEIFKTNQDNVESYENTIKGLKNSLTELDESVSANNEEGALNQQGENVKDLQKIWEDFIKTRQEATAAEEAAKIGMQQSARTMVSDMQTIAQEYPKAQKVAKAAAIGMTIYDTYSGATAAYNSFAKSPQAVLNPILYQSLGIAAATTAVVAGLARVQSIRKAQYGADFVTDGPQMMMVGEGSGPERVQVTPLSDPNIDGPQGQGITLNIQGNVLHESFVEDNIILQIREGLRLGENMGI